MTTVTQTTPTAGDGVGRNYRFEHFGLGIAMSDFAFSADALGPGDVLPDSTLIDVEGRLLSLRVLADGLPLVLVTGSISCPMTTAALPDLKEIATRHARTLRFALVQVREGHPGEHVAQPRTMDEKARHAQRLRDARGVDWPVLVDDLDGSLHRRLDTMPNSLHVIAPDGTVLYRALFAGDGRVAAALSSIARGEAPARRHTSRMMSPVLEAAGYMHSTLRDAGPRAYREVLTAAPPMAMMAMGTRLFPFLPEKRRGAALILMLALGAGAALSLL
ncbi:MAG: hypothetical protein OXU20_17675 [Myxococcales bacterium]|nr:hypothetical protein [Myxococcales bacterium]